MEAVRLVEEINRKERTSQDPKISGNRARLEIYGDGPEREKLETYCSKMKWEERVVFKGSRPLEELKTAYQNAHFVILPSRSEGWPKALAEAMFFGCIPIATSVSCVPWMLDDGNRGILLEDKAIDQRKYSVDSEQRSAHVEKISQLLANPSEMKRLSQAAKEWSQKYTLEGFEAAIKQVLLRANRR